MLKKISQILFICIVLFLVSGCNKNVKKFSNEVEIELIIYDKEEKEIYREKKSTKEKYLIDVMKIIDDLELKTENSEYGEYIVSIKGLEEGNNYYWNYYVNGEYAQIGVSNYKIQNNDIFEFKLEKFE